MTQDLRGQEAQEGTSMVGQTVQLLRTPDSCMRLSQRRLNLLTMCRMHYACTYRQLLRIRLHGVGVWRDVSINELIQIRKGRVPSVGNRDGKCTKQAMAVYNPLLGRTCSPGVS